MKLLLVLFILTGLLFSGIAMPLALRKMPPNYLYGFRVKKTLADENVWYEVNEYFGWRMFWLGILVVLFALAGFFVPGVSLLGYVALCSTATVVGLGVVIALTVRYMNGLNF